jgi:activating signal cointegrator 1
MKLISLWEPWATLMALGAKKIETRSWSTQYRGWLAIQASKGGLREAELELTVSYPDFHEALLGFQPFNEKIQVQKKGWVKEVFPHGHIVAIVKLVDCLPMQSLGCLPGVFEDYPEMDTPQERAFGNFDAGRWAWVTEGVFRLADPIPFSAKQGLNELPNLQTVQVMGQMAIGARR